MSENIIARRKALKCAGVFVTTVMPWHPGKQTADSAIEMTTTMGIDILTEQ